MSHTARTAIPAADMLLIKPSWWSRVGAGTRPPADRSRARHPNEGGQAIHESHRAPSDSTNPASQPQASHQEHLQAVQTLPLGRDEALIDRLQGRIRLQQDIAAQQALGCLGVFGLWTL